jgi:hypothetical protein
VHLSFGPSGRSLRRDQLRAAGLIDPRCAHFGAAKWLNFPIRTLRAYRWSVDHGIQEERAAWEAYRAARHRHRNGIPEPATQAKTNPASHHSGQVSAPPNLKPATGTPAPHADASPASTNGHEPTKAAMPDHAVDVDLDELRRRVHTAVDAGQRVTGATVGQWLGVSARTGRRRLAELIDNDPATAELLTDA